MNSWAVVGSKCICIDDDWNDELCSIWGITPPSRVPMLNEVLTIRGIYDCDWARGNIAMQFDELGHDFAFDINSFKPFISVSESDDINMFEKLASASRLDVHLEMLETAWDQSLD